MGSAINGVGTLLSDKDSTYETFKRYGLDNYSDEDIKNYLDNNPSIKNSIQQELQSTSLQIPEGYFGIWLSKYYTRLSDNINFINRGTWHASPECLNTNLSILDSRKFIGVIVRL